MKRCDEASLTSPVSVERFLLCLLNAKGLSGHQRRTPEEREKICQLWLIKQREYQARRRKENPGQTI